MSCSVIKPDAGNVSTGGYESAVGGNSKSASPGLGSSNSTTRGRTAPAPTPISYPSFSGNPAGGYTNVTALGPTGQGPVTIGQHTPYDMGWGTGSAYDPNTGLSKWSTNGLTNGEMYYDNWAAGLQAGEAGMKAASAEMIRAGALRDAQRKSAAERADRGVEIMKQLGTYNPAAQYYGMSAEDLADLETQLATMQQQQSEQQLNDLLNQFANPNYGGQPSGSLPASYAGTQTPAMTMDQMNAAIQAAWNDPNMTQAEKNQAISNAQQAYVASQAALKNQTPSAAGGGNQVAQINAQYQQAVQQQQQQASQQQQQQLAQEYQQAMDQANATNQARYDDIVAGYQDNQQRISDYLTSQGQQQTEDINRSYERLGGQNRQDLISRGLGNTTVLTSTERGIEEDRQRAQRNLTEQIDRQRLQYETAAQQNLLNFMERRNDQAPDYGQLADLSQGLGSAGGGTTGTGAVPTYTNPATGNPTSGGQSQPQYTVPGSGTATATDYSIGPSDNADFNMRWMAMRSGETVAEYRARLAPYREQQAAQEAAQQAGTGQPASQSSGYNPIYNTQPQQQAQPQVTPENVANVQRQQTIQQNIANTDPGNLTQGQGSIDYSDAMGSGYFNPQPQNSAANSSGATVGSPNAGTTMGTLNSGASNASNINPWTQPQLAQKVGAINANQRSINMRSSGIASQPSPSNQIPSNWQNVSQAGVYRVPGARAGR